MRSIFGEKQPNWVDVWYDRSSRSWVVEVKTEDGSNYEDGSTFVGTKEEAIDISDMKHRDYNLDPKHSKKKQKEHKEYLKNL